MVKGKVPKRLWFKVTGPYFGLVRFVIPPPSESSEYVCYVPKKPAKKRKARNAK